MKKTTRKLIEYGIIVAGGFGTLTVGVDMAYNSGKIKGLKNVGDSVVQKDKEIEKLENRTKTGVYFLTGAAALVGVGLGSKLRGRF